MYKAGYHTLKSLAWADANDLCQNIEHMPRNQARLIVSSAKVRTICVCPESPLCLIYFFMARNVSHLETGAMYTKSVYAVLVTA